MTETTKVQWEQLAAAAAQCASEGDFARAEEMLVDALQDALGRGDADLQVASSLGALAKLKARRGQRAQADALFRRALALREQLLGRDHYGIVQGLMDLGALHYAADELTAARTLYERALGICERTLGPEHPDLALALYNTARVYFKSGDHMAADPLLTRLLAITERTRGVAHQDVAAILAALARVRSMAGHHDEAEAMARRALAIREQYLAPDDPALATTLELVAWFCAGRAERERLLADAMRALRPTAGSAADAADAVLEDTLSTLALEERTLRAQARSIRARLGAGAPEPSTLERSPERASAPERVPARASEPAPERTQERDREPASPLVSVTKREPARAPLPEPRAAEVAREHPIPGPARIAPHPEVRARAWRAMREPLVRRTAAGLAAVVVLAGGARLALDHSAGRVVTAESASVSAAPSRPLPPAAVTPSRPIVARVAHHPHRAASTHANAVRPLPSHPQMVRLRRAMDRARTLAVHTAVPRVDSAARRLGVGAPTFSSP